MDTILRASHKIQKEKRIMIKFNTSAETIKKLIEKKFIIERYFQSQEDIFKLALKKKCSHILRNNKIELIK